MKELYQTGNEIAESAAKATGTTVTRELLGTAASMNGNKPLAEVMYENVKVVGMPKWSAGDQSFAKAVQVNNHLKVQPLMDNVLPLLSVAALGEAAGASDDVGDISWNVPTAMMVFPSNIPNATMHNVLAGMAMATPIAHKGVVAGAKVMAMTVLDLVTTTRAGRRCEGLLRQRPDQRSEVRLHAVADRHPPPSIATTN